MNFWPFNKASASKHLIIISIETGRVALSILELKPDQTAAIVYIARYLMSFDEIPAATELSRKVLDMVERAMTEVSKGASAKLLRSGEILLLLGSPWHVSWVSRVEVSRDKPFKVTNKIIEEAVDDNFSSSHDGFTIISRHIMGYKMNGYAMGNPEGKLTQSLDMHAYVESAPEVVLSSLKNVVRKHLPHLPMQFTTAIFSAVEAIKRSSNSKDFILILPEYDVSDVVLVRGGMIESSASLPWGAASMARELFGKGSSGIEEAFTKSTRFLAGQLDEGELIRATKLAQEVRVRLISSLRNILWKMNEALLLPNACVVVGDNLAAHFIAKWLEDEDYSTETFMLEEFKISQVSGKDVAPTLAIDIGGQEKIPFSTISGTIIGRAFESTTK